MPSFFLLAGMCAAAVVCSSSNVAADEITTLIGQIESEAMLVPDAVPGELPMPTPPLDGAMPMPVPGQQTPGQPGSESKPEGAGQNSVKRPGADKYVPQPIDTELRKNPDGKVAFNIKGQPWEPVLQWLSDASALSLDWQELPGDSLNLITTREYTLEEARDLVNRHLLSRGFTMIVNGEVMSIMKVKDLNPAMVQRVAPEELDSLPDHTMCKVSFNLDWLIADEAVEELKPMLSSAGQIHKLSRTNRLEVIDTAISLRQIWELIESEQSTDGEEHLVRAFRLQHRRAEDVMGMLRDLLRIQGPEKGGMDTAGMDPNMAMQMAQQMQQMQMQAQQAAAQAGVPPGGAPKAKVETRLVLNQKENMILVQAAPDQMAVVEKAIEQIDVEGDNGMTLLQNINRMKIYRLESVDPQTLADLLQQLGDLDPGTVLKVDKQKRSIIAWATIADHLTITTLVDKLDQSSRKIEVIPLRRLDAEYVAGTIRLLMGKEEEKENSNPYAQRYGFFDFGMQNQQAAKEPSFKVEADTENNRLLVNANSIEMQEIEDLLIKLGEMPDPNAASDGIRVFEMNPDEDLRELRQQLERYWRRGNSLEFDLPNRPAVPSEEGSSKTPKGAPATPANVPSAVAPTTALPRGSQSIARVQIWSKRKQQPTTAPGQTAPGDALTQMLRAAQEILPRDTAHQSSVLTSFTDEQTPAAKHGDQNTVEPSGDSPQPEALTTRGTEELDEPSLNEQPSDEQPSGKQPPRLSRQLIEKLRQQLNEGIDEPKSDRSLPNHTSEDRDLPADVSEMKRDGSSSPVKIAMTPDGKLIVTSSDPQALAAMEELVAQIVAPRRSFKVFRLKYATPSWVTLNLKDFFKADEETKTTMEYNPYWGVMPAEKKVKGSRTLSKRRQPQFISDNFTSTILVRDADAKQLQTIEDLIAIYDVPEPSDTRSMRVTTIFRLEHAKASSVAAAIKDVFRDLLSSNDKALEKDDKGQQRQGSGGLVTFLPGASAKDGADEEEPIRFKGLLSIGIDESSNTLIVSSAGTLMETIGEMIESLDEAADSSSVVQVLKVDRSVDLTLIQERLRELMKTSQPQQPVVPGQPVPGEPGSLGIQPAVESPAAE